jgi:LysM repeat protein
MKKQFFLSIIVTGGMALVLCGCEAMGGRDRDAQMQKQQFEMVRAQTNQMNQVTASISALQNSNAELVRIVNESNQKISNLEQRSVAMEKNISNLQQQLGAEKQERQTTINRMIDQISKEVSKASVPAPSSTATGPVGTGEFYEHKIESGATLGTIAKAYGVTVQEIMTANRMKKDASLRVGQTLYVPKKK